MNKTSYSDGSWLPEDVLALADLSHSIPALSHNSMYYLNKRRVGSCQAVLVPFTPDLLIYSGTSCASTKQPACPF
jgi:hypothetical protein